MNNKTYIKLKEKYETELIDLTKTALLETDIDSLDSLVKNQRDAFSIVFNKTNIDN